MMVHWLYIFNCIIMTRFACRLFITLQDTGYHTNSWIISFVSIERVISVCGPHKFGLVWTINRTRCINIFLWLFCIVIFNLFSQMFIAYSDGNGVICATFNCFTRFVVGYIHTTVNIIRSLTYVTVLGSSFLIVIKLYTKTIKKSVED